MKIKIMKDDTGSCALDCDFKNDDWCNLFYAKLYGTPNSNPTRCNSCIALTDTDAKFTTQRYEIDELSKCFGCQRYRKGFYYNCTAGNLCGDGHLNWFRR